MSSLHISSQRVTEEDYSILCGNRRAEAKMGHANIDWEELVD